MNSIIVPVDFSSAALGALQYAYQLAQTMRFKNVSLFHAYQTPLVESVGSLEQLEKMSNDVRNEKNLQLQNFAQLALVRIAPYQDIQLEFITIEGIITELLANYVESQHLIVMGTQGQEHSGTFTHGSHTSEEMLNVSAPILVVPVGCTYKAPKSILYAIDYENYDRSILHSLSSFADVVGASVTLLHINSSKGYFDEMRMANYRKTLHDILPNENMKLDFVSGEDLEHVLISYLTEKQIDLPVLVSRKGTILKNQYADSFSRQMTMRTQTPLLIFHASDN